MSQTRLLDAVDRSQGLARFYQARDAAKATTIHMLKGELIRQHQHQLFHSNSPRFAVMRQHVYEHFRERVFPTWDPARYPDGVYWKNAFIDAKLEIDTLGLDDLDGATYRRRLNELADKHVTNPPLLEWTRPGYYRLANLEASK